VDVVFKKKSMVKSVIYLLFSYQTGYIMWHSRLMIYISFGCTSGNVTLYTLSDSWIIYKVLLHWISNLHIFFLLMNILYCIFCLKDAFLDVFVKQLLGSRTNPQVQLLVSVDTYDKTKCFLSEDIKRNNIYIYIWNWDFWS
jgi:hypothetical protein